MKRIGTCLVALVVLAVGGCQGGDDPPSGGAASPSVGGSSPAASAGATPATPTPSASADVAVEFTVDGAGPYELGADINALQDAPGLAQIASGVAPCPKVTSAVGTGPWAEVKFFFHEDGKLFLAVNRSPSVPTPSGAWIGDPLARLKSIYAGLNGEEVLHGSRKAYLVTTLSGRGILFDLDSRGLVGQMMAGDAQYMRRSYQGGKGFC